MKLKEESVMYPMTQQNEAAEDSTSVDDDAEYEAVINQLAEAYAEEEAGALAAASPLFTIDSAKTHLKQEFKDAVRLQEHGALLKQAIRCIIQEGPRYLEKEEWNQLSEELQQAASALDRITYEDNLPEVLYPHLGITLSGMLAIDKISREKYKEENFSQAAAVNVLLVTLDPYAVDYWLHLGISYQDCGFYEKAIKAYSICHALNPAQISSWIYCSECYLNMDNKEEAIRESKEAEKLIENTETTSSWEEYLHYLHRRLNN